MYEPSGSAHLTPLPGQPRPSCYRVPGLRIIAGEYPGHPSAAIARVKIRALLQAGVTLFLDLTEPGERPRYDHLLGEEALALDLEVRHQRYPVRDLGVPLHRRLMRDILETLDRAIVEERTTYLHCWAGVGRTGMVVGCLLRRSGASGDESLARLGDLWQTAAQSERYPRSPETDEQCAYVRDWPPKDETCSSSGPQRSS